MPVPESDGEYILQEIREILDGIAGLHQENVDSPAATHAYPFVVADVGIEESESADEGGDGQRWHRYAGIILRTIVRRDTTNEGRARWEAEAWGMRIKLAFLNDSTERAMAFADHRTKIESIVVDGFAPGLVLADTGEVESTLTLRVVYAIGPLS